MRVFGSSLAHGAAAAAELVRSAAHDPAPSPIEDAQIMERKIVVYGHGDKRPGLGFPTESDMEQWIK
jgi:hypothetical protein